MKWKTKAGQVIDIKDMDNNHLANAIKFLKRKINAYPGYQCYVGNSVYAEDAVEHENRMNEERLFECHRALIELKKEQERRNI